MVEYYMQCIVMCYFFLIDSKGMQISFTLELGTFTFTFILLFFLKKKMSIKVRCPSLSNEMKFKA